MSRTCHRIIHLLLKLKTSVKKFKSWQIFNKMIISKLHKLNTKLPSQNYRLNNIVYFPKISKKIVD